MSQGLIKILNRQLFHPAGNPYSGFCGLYARLIPYEVIVIADHVVRQSTYESGLRVI